MPIDVWWDTHDPTILRYTIYERWTAYDAKQTLDTTGLLVEGLNERFDLIVEFKAGSYFITADLTGLWSRIDYHHSRRGDKRGIIAVVKAPLFVSAIIKAAERIAYSVVADMYLVNTVEEAYTLIQTKRAEKLLEHSKAEHHSMEMPHPH